MKIQFSNEDITRAARKLLKEEDLKHFSLERLHEIAETVFESIKIDSFD